MKERIDWRWHVGILYLAATARNVFKNGKSSRPPTRAGRFWKRECRVSELVSQCKLHFSRAVDGAENGTGRTVGRSCMWPAEDVAVECVDEVSLQRQAVRFRKPHPFDDREILVDVGVTSDFARNARHVSKHISAISDEIGGIRIKEGSAIEVGSHAWRRSERPVAFLRAPYRRVGRVWEDLTLRQQGVGTALILEREDVRWVKF